MEIKKVALILSLMISVFSFANAEQVFSVDSVKKSGVLKDTHAWTSQGNNDPVTVSDTEGINVGVSIVADLNNRYDVKILCNGVLSTIKPGDYFACITKNTVWWAAALDNEFTSGTVSITM